MQDVGQAITHGSVNPDPTRRLLEALQRESCVSVSGLSAAGRAYVLSRVKRAGFGPLLCVAADEDGADRLAKDLDFFFGGKPSAEGATPSVLRLPGEEVLPYDDLSPDAVCAQQRLAALFHLSQGSGVAAVVLSARALARKQLPLRLVDSLSEVLAPNLDIERDKLAARLVELGYASVPLVEDPGTFAVRGAIVDVFSPLYDKPARIEFFGDTVESLRLFEPESQRTAAELKELAICPARELLFSPENKRSAIATLRATADAVNYPSLKLRETTDRIEEGVHSFGLEALLPGFYEGGLDDLGAYLKGLPEGASFYVDQPELVGQSLEDLWLELHQGFTQARERGELALEPERHFLSPSQVRELLTGRKRIERIAERADLEPRPILFTFAPTADLRKEIESHHGESGALTPLVSRLSRWREAGIASCVACGSPGQSDRLRRLLLDRDVPARAHAGPLPEDPRSVYDPSVFAHLFVGEISGGFVDHSGGLALVSDEEVFGARIHKPLRKARAEQPFVAAFRELNEGDLVVHVDFGIARYAGLTKMQIRGTSGDFLVLEYEGRDKVYLPVSRMRLVQKFVGADAETVKLDRLGSDSWQKRKARVKENLLKMAAELLRIYAARKAHPGFAYSEPDRYYRQFEADFEFDATPDQEKAIAEVLADMQSERPMDRLVCGDVGYGKTEVAMRAAFKAVLDKKQVAVLVPTTVLAAQHERTFKERFKGYPVRVEAISRMRASREVRETLKRVTEGQVDILIGTHRLLGGDVSFKDLGLIVVDEEQRFGVKHKERLKKLRTQVDVLTLTATPIPRTLHMSMAGIRDMSIIATPPEDRRAIRTFVMKFDPAPVREAILREMQRGGQVFFLHNRVQSIGAMEQFLKENVPEAKVAIAHGQMAEGKLEEVMTEFVEHKYDVLLCTSIIESGLDISSANTIIVNRADEFGLSQLYQIRGRVGRSKERAYAYLLVPNRRPITKDAQKRLEVLQSFTELGAGFSIASHDLEIRGGGNLLGPDQSGHIAAVGFDLYAQLMDEAVHELRGEPLREEIDPEVTLPVPAMIPDDYLPDVHQRLLFYKRFSQAQSDDEIQDLRSELVDRCGELPEEAERLCELMELKIDLRKLRVRSLEAGPGRLVLSLGQDAALDPKKLASLLQKGKGGYRLTPDMKLVAKIDAHLAGANLLSAARNVVREIVACA